MGTLLQVVDTEVVEESVETIEVIVDDGSIPGDDIPAQEPEIVTIAQYFDVSLNETLQDHIFTVCEEYQVDPSIIVAMIENESEFYAGAIGDGGNSFGLMQIQPRWHKERMERLGCDDLLDPYQNVMVGVDYISELIECDKGMTWALMAYNGGPSYANKKAAAGEVSQYATDILHSEIVTDWQFTHY
jgi:soluble lytic murein transglycosylase-like protein